MVSVISNSRFNKHSAGSRRRRGRLERSAIARRLPGVPAFLLVLAGLGLAGCGGDDTTRFVDRPVEVVVGDDPVSEGREVFRFETFGNERFWTDFMQLPQGIAQAEVTPLTALSLGLNVNVEALSPGTAAALLDALAMIEDGANPQDTVLSNPQVTLALINEGAVIGVVPFAADGSRKPLGSDADFNANDSLDLARGDKVGVTCALCHARTDDSVVPAGFAGPGSVGVQVDGVVAEGIDVGNIFAASANPLAYLPLLQLEFDALDGATIGNGDFTGIPSDGTIDDLNQVAREYLTGVNEETGIRYYAVTSFDATPDGIGNATYVPPFFRTDLAAPWGHSGSFARLNDFNNLVYTVALDPTSLRTDEGKAFLNVLAGPVGDEITQRYQQILEDSGVLSSGMALDDQVPLVDSETTGIAAGDPTGPVGVRVSDDKLDALKAYTDQLESPAAPQGLDAEMVAAGEAIFRNSRPEGANCAACHTPNPNDPVANIIVSITTLYRDYEDDLLVLLERDDPLSNVQTTLAGPTPDYDNTLVVLDASVRQQQRGFSKPLLLGLADKDEFLHNGSVKGEDAAEALNNLFNPARGEDEMGNPVNSPHPFYFPRSVADETPATEEGRAALVEYLLSRTTL